MTKMEAVGEEIAVRFAGARPSRILTAEVSGIMPAAMAAYRSKIPTSSVDELNQ